MYGHPPSFRPGGSGRGGAKPPQQHQQQQEIHQNPNFFPDPNLFFLQNTSNLFPNLNPYSQNLYSLYPIQEQSPSNSFPKLMNPENNKFQNPLSNNVNNYGGKYPQQQGKLKNELIEKLDKEVTRMRHELIASNENVSAWKVSQEALLMVTAVSWESLGFRMQQVPSLNRLLVTEGKINAFIHSFVAVGGITSLFDLEMAICKSEGVERFEELELGPLARHPLAVHYFSVSSDLTEVHRINTEQIISYLCEFLDTHKKKEINVDAFLDYMALKQSVTGKEKLCVRVQNFGQYIKYINLARESEDTVLTKCFKKFKTKSFQAGDRRGMKYLFPAGQKKELDEHFTSISQRVKSFSLENNQFCGKHIRFVSSSSDDEVEEESEGEKMQEQKTQGMCCLPLSAATIDRVSSCPYPSATEEMARLGLKSDECCSPTTTNGEVMCLADENILHRKRKSQSMSSSLFLSAKSRKRDTFCTYQQPKTSSIQWKGDCSITEESLKIFITTWKEACSENNAYEVLEMMFQFYKTRKQKKVKALFNSYPFAGLLNVAVTCIKFGMCDNMFDTFQVFRQQETDGKTFESSADCINVDVEPAKENLVVSGQQTILLHDLGVKAEDIANKISEYFEDLISGCINLCQENRFFFLKKLCKCEYWLIEQYSVKEFESLGWGEYFMFLQKYMHLLPHALQACLMGEVYEEGSLGTRLLPRQLDVLLFQALNNLGANETIDQLDISELLARQFPLVCLKFVKSDPLENLTDILQEKRCKAASSCLLFSRPLLRSSRTGKTLEVDVNTGATEEITDAITSNGAIEVLLEAPMLTDLNLWSHWDLLFAPSLGSMVEWLLNDVNRKDLLCLVTKDGKVIRVDHSATIDSFIKGFGKGSAFETAVQLLSLFVLYGGERNWPLSLLKCHARQGFEAIINNSLRTELNVEKSALMPWKPYYNQQIIGITGSNYLGGKLHTDRSMLGESIPLMSRFILDCLSYLPIEFCGYAADILISGLQSFVKDVPTAVLSECKQIEERLILHEVGICLGIVEWADDYYSFRSSSAAASSPRFSCLDDINLAASAQSVIAPDLRNTRMCSVGGMVCGKTDYFGVGSKQDVGAGSTELSVACWDADTAESSRRDDQIDKDPARVIESIRKEEFGLDDSLSATENRMLEKQHARLGRALHCLSQELYSQDSHFILELVQNADDNVYPIVMEPTLMFILEEKGIIVLNNECGFSADNIRALCDVGNSTKKSHNAGYIGKKGIGFKSVFRVTDAPEIHSNGFHIKFDITKGQIGFILPTIIPPCDIGLYTSLASTGIEGTNCNAWNTCIVLPFRPSLSKGFAMNGILSMFSDLHPSLLLFLHRLRCIKFRNLLDDSLIVMRKEVVDNGIVRVALGNEKMNWLVASRKLQADAFCSDAQTTEISIAFTLMESDDGVYTPILNQQPVFAFLPLRTYGLRFILQGDFVLPSSREEVDGNSPWNQWLLTEFPDLFVTVERLFCDLPCYRACPGKAVTAYMSYVPLVGEVHGFFSSIPRMVISKLCMSNCLLLDREEQVWVPPCMVLRNWTDEARSLLPESLLEKHLGLGFLNKDIVLSDSLASELGVEDYGPKILIKVISSLCHADGGLKSMDLSWLSSLLNALYLMISVQISPSFGSVPDFVIKLQKTKFIPLSNGNYGSVSEGMIWLHSDSASQGIGDEYVLKSFPKLSTKLRIVSPDFLAAAASMERSSSDTTIVENVKKMLYKVGVQWLSAHEIVKLHILPAISDDTTAVGLQELMIEYLSFAMFHLQSSCTTCILEKSSIIEELHNRALILTNYGHKRSSEVPIHFSLEYGNPVDVNNVISGLDMKWYEIDPAYLKHPINESLSDGLATWRKFFLEIGVTDFVQVVQVERRIADMSLVNIKDMMLNNSMVSMDSVAKNWESRELFNLLSSLSLNNDGEKSKCLLEILDRLWDSSFCDKVIGHCLDSSGESKPFKSSFVSIIQDIPWIFSNIGRKLHYPKDLFHNCTAVNLVLGAHAPYTIPEVRSEKLLSDIGLKTQVTLDDALCMLRVWRSECPFKASVSQMSNFYTLLCKEMSVSKNKILEEFQSGSFIFVPYSSSCSHADIVAGAFLSAQEVYWSDTTGSVDQMEYICPESDPVKPGWPIRRMLCNFYPILHDFFVYECGVDETPPLRSYLHILLHLSSVALPHQAAKRVLEVFLRWDDALESGSLSFEDVEHLKESLLEKEYAVLPTKQDKWVSLHASFGLICWCDDDSLGREFKHFDGVDFLYFGEFTDVEKQITRAKISNITQRLGIPALSQVVTREAIYYGPADSTFMCSLIDWILPYAQRYILNLHPDKYFQLKQSGFENLLHLKIVVVEKLFYRNVIRGAGIISKKRNECNCILQGSTLYCSQESDPHSIFLEFSRLLYDGTSVLNLANFLHMIFVMAESGATEEQTEFFILNSQKVPKLPVEESCWSLQSPSSAVENDAGLLENCLVLKEEPSSAQFKRRHGINSSWPPADWKTAPGFGSISPRSKKSATSIFQIKEGNLAAENLEPTETASIQISSGFNTEVDPFVISPIALPVDAEISGTKPNLPSDLVPSRLDVMVDSVDLVAPDNKDAVTISSKDPVTISSNTRDEILAQQAKITGRLGEFVALKYFEQKYGGGTCRWVNEANETGLPYDITVGSEETSSQYVEVKATKVARKNWFLISMREWQFAIEKGESFSIAHVILMDDNMARVAIYKNPARLCQLGNLKLAFVVPK